jgi:hypothetical protein
MEAAVSPHGNEPPSVPLNSFTAEELLREFYAPDAVREILAKYHVPPPTAQPA